MVQHMMHHSKDIIQECISTVVWSFDEPNACNLIVIHVLDTYILNHLWLCINFVIKPRFGFILVLMYYGGDTSLKMIWYHNPDKVDNRCLT